MKKKERKGKRDQGRKFWDRKLWKKGAAAAAAVLLLCAALAIFLSGDGRKEDGSADMQEAESFPAGSASGKEMVNLALSEGVRVTAQASAGGIENLRLLAAPQPCIAYVALHECCHFLHPNHGKGFYQLLSALMPDWQERKRQLEETAGRWL